MKIQFKNFIPSFFFTNSPHVTSLFLGQNNCFVPRIILIIFINFITALVEGSAFGLLILALSVIAPSGVSITHIPFATHFSEGPLFALLIVGAIGMQGIKSILSYVNAQITTALALKIQIAAQTEVYRCILQFDFTTVNQYKIGELAALTNTPSHLFQTYLGSCRELILNSAIILTYFMLMLKLSFMLTFITLGSTGVILYIQKTFMNLVNVESEKMALAVQKLSTQITEHLNGMRTIFTFNRQNYTLQDSKNNLEKVACYSKTMYRWMNSANSINELLSIILVGTLLIVAYFVLAPSNPSALPSITAFMGISYRLAARLPMINGNLSTLSTKKGDCVLLEKILNRQGKSFRSTSGVPFTHFNHSITFEHIFFNYPNTNQETLKDVSFSIKKSNIAAIVGHSGAGKSTLIDLLSGFYPPSQGKILIDGIDQQTYSADSWRSHLGIVSQDVFIFNHSIAENIRYGKLEASDEEVHLAAKQAGAHLFISALKEGYETIVGEKGYLLSGGEKQRISLARTLLRDPEILILDEATSNLDSESERIIQDSINEFHHKKTLIIIAHRLSTIKKADQIIVLEQGRVIEQGSHFSLLELEGKYSKFWNLQTMHS